jgi:hypothetical protein
MLSSKFKPEIVMKLLFTAITVFLNVLAIYTLWEAIVIGHPITRGDLYLKCVIDAPLAFAVAFFLRWRLGAAHPNSNS